MNRHFPAAVLNLLRPRKRWSGIDGWFQWREAQQEAVAFFDSDSSFVEVGVYLGRSLCSLAEVIQLSGKEINVIGIDTCRGSGPEGWRNKNYHGNAVQEGGGTFAGTLHRNILECGFADRITLIISDSVNASRLFTDASIDWVHLDARHDYESVCADIRAWLPKLKSHGWISGDDYDEVKWPSVVRAVSDLLPDAHAWGNQQWRCISCKSPARQCGDPSSPF
jgi:hypothetical protein